MYVRRWPRISASSRTPPSDMRTNSRPVARAIDSPIDVLPVPGGPISVRIAPELLVLRDAALLAQLAHGQVLGDAVLDVLQARVVGVEHLARVDRIEPLLGALRPTARRSASRGRCGSSTTRPLLAHPLEAAQLPLGLLADLVRHPGVLDLRCGTRPRPSPRPRPAPCGSTPSGLRRKYSRCCFWAPDSTSSRMRLRTSSSASRSRWIASASSSRSRHVERLEQLDLLRGTRRRAIAGRVGQRAGLGDRADERGDPPVVAADLEDLLDHRAILALELAVRPSSGSSGSGLRLDVDAERSGRISVCSAGDAAVQAVHRDGTTTTGQPDLLDHFADGADLRVLALVDGDEQNAILAVASHGQGDVMFGKTTTSSRGTSKEPSSKSPL